MMRRIDASRRCYRYPRAAAPGSAISRAAAMSAAGPSRDGTATLTWVAPTRA
jgi:hypothetical protein